MGALLADAGSNWLGRNSLGQLGLLAKDILAEETRKLFFDKGVVRSVVELQGTQVLEDRF